MLFEIDRKNLTNLVTVAQNELAVCSSELASAKINAEIAEIAGMAEETAKKHCKHILAKLEVKNRHQAVDKAIEYGLIEPKRV